MGRGGILKRKKLGEDSLRKRYALNGIPKGTRIAACLDKYGRWDLGQKLGTIVSRGNGVYVAWDGVDDFERFEEGDARYLVDRGKWKLYIPPSEKNPLTSMNMRSEQPLTSAASDGRIAASPQKGRTQETEEKDMPDEQAEEKTFSAKQVATRIGTDAKSLRKFFRTHSSLVEAVGQGGRYDFAADDIPRIEEEFKAWKKNAGRRGTKKEVAPTPEEVEEAEEQFEDLDDAEPDEDELENLGEPDPEELEDIDDLMEVLDDEEDE